MTMSASDTMMSAAVSNLNDAVAALYTAVPTPTAMGTQICGWDRWEGGRGSSCQENSFRTPKWENRFVAEEGRV